MISRARASRALAGFVLLGNLASGAAPAEEKPALLSEEAAGSVDVAGETTLVVEGLPGEIAVMAGEKGTLLYSSEINNPRKPPLPVALWLDGDTFRFVPPAGARAIPGLLTIWVPPSMRVFVSASESAVRVTGIEGGVTVKGLRDRVEITNAQGPVTVETEEGSVTATRCGSSVTIRGRGLNTTVEDSGGTLLLQLARGNATVKSARAGVDGELEGVDLKVDGAGGACRFRLKGGRADLAGLQAGAQIVVSGGPLTLERSQGTFGIESDKEFKFRDLEGAVQVTSYAGAVRGSVLKGSLEVTGAGGEEVQVASVSNSVTVGGAGLAARLSDLGGEVTVRTSSAPVQIENAVGPLTVENEFGDVTASRVFHPVKIRSKGGSVRVTDLNGPVDIVADGPEVEVSWVSLDPGSDSTIENEGGSVSVRFPAAGGCRLEASAKYGRVQAAGLPGVTVSQGGAQAQGTVGRVSRPTVKIVANGDVLLSGNAASEGSQEP